MNHNTETDARNADPKVTTLRPLNAETLGGNKPMGERDYFACSFCEARFPSADVRRQHELMCDKPVSPQQSELPARDALHASGEEIAAVLEWHAAALAKRGIHGVAYDLRVAAAKIRQLDESRAQKDGLDWQIDWSDDHGLSAVCPDCGGRNVTRADSLHLALIGCLQCEDCGMYGVPRQ